MDPQNEIENEMAANEGIIEDEEHAGRFPSEEVTNLLNEDLPSAKSSSIYQQIPIPKNNSELSALREACRILDAIFREPIIFHHVFFIIEGIFANSFCFFQSIFSHQKFFRSL